MALLLAMVQDVLLLRISNLLSVAVVALFLVWATVCGWDSTIWQNLVNFLLVLGVGLFLFARGWLGGGDVKLFAASALWFDWQGIASLIGAITLTGGAFTILLIGMRRMLPRAVGPSGAPAILKRGGPIPYGVAIAIGAVICLYWVGPNPSGAVRLPSFIHA